MRILNTVGLDQISYQILKMLDIHIADALKSIINLSLKIRKYPTSWSTSVLKPLYKGGGKDERKARSYKPVALLSGMARVAEGILSSQMNSFAEETGLIHPSVHGYRGGMSTTTTLIEVQDRLINAMDDGKISTLCLLDVSSGFDTVSHIFLLRKYELYGYDDNALEWLSSYLKNRVQIVQVQASRSRSALDDKRTAQ